jgi:hypothetical protein
MHLRSSIRVASWLAVLALASCSESEDEGDSANDDGNDDGPTDVCASETRDDTYMLGLTKAGEQIQVRFVDAVPAPPARFENTWTVEVLDMDGMLLDDVSIEVTPFMPDHNHGTTVVTHVEPGENPGEYVFDPVSLHMAGLWEVTIDVTLADETTDSVVFAFCINP